VHQEGSLYHPEIGLAGVLATLQRGAERVTGLIGMPVSGIAGAWVGLPAFGEDSRIQVRLEAIPMQAFPGIPVDCGNDLECSHAGALGGLDGISLVSGTGSMTWGTWLGRSARCGGWGEIFGDEGSAYWIAREGLALFSRMSDGRAERGILYDVMRSRTGIVSDLDLSGRVINDGARSAVAGHAVSVHEAALAGDAAAREIFCRAARELLQLIRATRRLLGVPLASTIAVSTSGSVLREDGLVLQDLRRLLCTSPQAPGHGPGRIELRTPVMTPALGAVTLAARACGRALSPAAVANLAQAAPVLD
jgi:N-acetylglucosamine kinase-like BadF-type ATPase